MKHIFYIYNMARVDDHIYYSFIDKIKQEFISFGYKLDSEIIFLPFDKKYKKTPCDSHSAIVISTESICNETSPYGNGNSFWPYIDEKIDLILISGSRPIIYWPSVSTPILPLEKLDYTSAVRILINYNT